MGRRVRIRVTQGGDDVCRLHADGPAEGFDAEAEVRALAARSGSPTAFVTMALCLRHRVASGRVRRGDHALRLGTARDGFDDALLVAFAADGTASVGPDDAGRAERPFEEPVEPSPYPYYEALWSETGGYAFVDLREADGGSTVLGAPGEVGHGMTMEDAEAAATDLDEGLEVMGVASVVAGPAAAAAA